MLSQANWSKFNYSGLLIGPGDSVENYEDLPITGHITVSITCSEAWTGSLEYAEGDPDNILRCSNLGTGATHTTGTTASNDAKYYAEIIDDTGGCP